MVPELPTPTNLVVSSVVVVVVVPEFSVESSFSSLQEMTVKLKRKRERIMRRCFIGFLIGYFRNTLNIPQFRGVSQESGDFTWRVSDCEGLVGGYSQEMMGFVFVGDYCFFPFTHFILMFPFLSNNERFQGLFPLNSPAHFLPSVKVNVP